MQHGNTKGSDQTPSTFCQDTLEFVERTLILIKAYKFPKTAKSLDHMLAHANTDDYPKCTLEGLRDLSGRMAALLPDIITNWKFRWNMVLAMTNALTTDCVSTIELMRKIFQVEQEVWTKALQKNPKSYSTWQHRKLVTVLLLQCELNGYVPKVSKDSWSEFNLLNPSDLTDELLENAAIQIYNELRDIETYLSRDNRNFHAWGARAWLLSIAKQVPGLYEESTKRFELSQDYDDWFTRTKIDEDLSNYSAWHARTLIDHLDPFQEAETVIDGIWTDPSDEGLWSYLETVVFHRCLKPPEGNILPTTAKRVNSKVYLEFVEPVHCPFGVSLPMGSKFSKKWKFDHKDGDTLEVKIVLYRGAEQIFWVFIDIAENGICWIRPNKIEGLNWTLKKSKFLLRLRKNLQVFFKDKVSLAFRRSMALYTGKPLEDP